MTENDNHTEEIVGKRDNRLIFEVKRAMLENAPAPDAEEAYQDFLERNHIKPRKRKALWLSIATLAAAACVGILLVIAPWKEGDNRHIPPMQQPNKELAKMGNVVYQAAEQRQYISISMGDKTIDLSDQSSARDAGIAITRDNIIQVFDRHLSNHDDMTITVPAGQTAKLMLDDGTKVSINAGSQLTFPHHFRKEGMREVKLYGEAYFEVTHDETRPFYVTTGGMRTKVLGTKFNVRYFKDESCRVSLTEGIVEVTHDNNDTYLKPDETAWLRNGQLETEPTDNDLALGWLNGEFYFDGQTLQEITTEIGRWYNLNVVFANTSHLNEQLHFSADRTAPINEIVRQLQLIGNARIELRSKDHVLLIK